MELNDLPDDLLLKIFFHLSLCSLNDISGFTLTCKKWRRILWSKEVFQRINSFKYQSRFLIYRCSPSNSVNENSLHEFLECDSHSTIPYLAVNHDSPNLKQDIKNCPLINMTVSMWCRTLNESPFMVDGTILLLWHFHLGYMGFHREGHGTEYALVKCTYTKQHLLNTTFRLELNKWYHVAIVIKEKEGLQLYINGNRVGDWALEENINKHNLLIAPDSSIWLASHCGAQKWSGSLSDICLWKRCLEPYEIKEMARTRTGIEKINFIPHICD